MRASTTTAGLRAVAIFEAAKGLAVLLLGLGLLGLLHHNVEATADALLVHLHVSPDRRISHALLHAASRLTDARLWGIAAGAVAYTCVRFTEAWGLWRRRDWAQWFALLSGAMYLPWEFVGMLDHANWLHVILFVGNVAILLYMLFIRIQRTS